MWLGRIDGHAGWANSKALELAGIDADTPDPVGGRIVRDESGKATGILIDKAMELVEIRIPPPDTASLRAAYRLAVNAMLPLGITGVHDAGVDLQRAEVLIDGR